MANPILTTSDGHKITFITEYLCSFWFQLSDFSFLLAAVLKLLPDVKRGGGCRGILPFEGVLFWSRLGFV
jgi:hypothetical protein